MHWGGEEVGSLALPRGRVPAHTSPIPGDAVMCKVTTYGSAGDASCPESQEQREDARGSWEEPAEPSTVALPLAGVGRDGTGAPGDTGSTD